MGQQIVSQKPVARRGGTRGECPQSLGKRRTEQPESDIQREGKKGRGLVKCQIAGNVLEKIENIHQRSNQPQSWGGINGQHF